MKARYPVDMQTHTTFSDGTFTPAEVVAMAAESGLRAIAITDHDSVLGVDEAMVAGDEDGVEVIPAIELSTRHEPARGFVDLDILGYWIDPHHPDLTATLKKVIDARVEQKIAQVEIMQGYGVDVPVEEVLALAKGVPGRPHIAQVALERNPGRFRDIEQVYDEFLSNHGKAYRPRAFSLTVEDAIELVLAAGGMPVLAHPGLYDEVEDLRDVIRRARDAGLAGLEIRYPYDKTGLYDGISPDGLAGLFARFGALADEFGLAHTGASDFHGTRKPIMLGEQGLTWEEYVVLKEKARTASS